MHTYLFPFCLNGLMKTTFKISYKTIIINLYDKNKLTFLVEDDNERCHHTLDTNDYPHSYNNR